VWFANDGKGTFAPAQHVEPAGGEPFSWAPRGQARAIEAVDWDGDGQLDLVVATPQLILHRGGAAGFTARGESLGVTAEAFAIADCDGDGVHDLLTVPPSTTSSSAVTLHLRRGGILQPGRAVLPFTGDTGQAQLAVADWNADGRPDVLLAEVLHGPPTPALDEAAAGEQKAKLVAAERVLAAIHEQLAELNRTPPPRNDAAAMARRDAWRQQLTQWAEAPRALRDQLQSQARAQSRPLQSSRLRAIFL
jgi:hypothetical protein